MATETPVATQTLIPTETPAVTETPPEVSPSLTPEVPTALPTETVAPTNTPLPPSPSVTPQPEVTPEPEITPAEPEPARPDPPLLSPEEVDASLLRRIEQMLERQAAREVYEAEHPPEVPDVFTVEAPREAPTSPVQPTPTPRWRR